MWSVLGRKKNFLKVLADSGDSISPKKDEKPLSLQAMCGNVLLHSAISEENIENVENLLKLGVPVNAALCKKDNLTPLYLAVECGNGDIIDLLVDYGANVFETTKTGASFLHYAVSKHNADVVHVLLSAGLDANMKYQGSFPLLYRAAEENDIEIADVLYGFGANIFTDSDESLVHLAVARKSVDAIRCFAGLDIDLDLVDCSNRSPLRYAASLGNISIVNELISNGADMYLRNAEGETLLHVAVREDDLTTLKTILVAGMDVNVRGGWWNMTPLHVAVHTRNLKMAKVLIEKGASTTIETSDGKTALDMARCKGDIFMTNYLTLHSSESSLSAIS